MKLQHLLPPLVVVLMKPRQHCLYQQQLETKTLLLKHTKISLLTSGATVAGQTILYVEFFMYVYILCFIHTPPKTDGHFGTSNNSQGTAPCDFELPMWMYGNPRTPGDSSGDLSNGEFGLLGALCNASTYPNCGQLGSDGTPVYLTFSLPSTFSTSSPRLFPPRLLDVFSLLDNCKISISWQKSFGYCAKSYYIQLLVPRYKLQFSYCVHFCVHSS
jgi:hypothetical protein